MTGHHLQRRQFTVSSRRYTLLHAGYTGVARPLALVPYSPSFCGCIEASCSRAAALPSSVTIGRRWTLVVPMGLNASQRYKRWADSVPWASTQAGHGLPPPPRCPDCSSVPL